MLVIRQWSVSGLNFRERNIQPREREISLCSNQLQIRPFYCYSFLLHLPFALENAQARISNPTPKRSAKEFIEPPALAADSSHSLGCVLPELLLFTQSHLMNGNFKHSLDVRGV